MSSSNSFSSSMNRIDFIKLQIRIVLIRLTDASMGTLLNTIDSGLDKQWISAINIYAMDNQNLCRAQLSLSINWDEHNRQLSLGRSKITINPKSGSNTSIEVSESANFFEGYVNQNSLTIKWQVSVPANVNFDEACRVLGIKRAEPPTWAKSKDGIIIPIPEATEMAVGLYCV